MESKLDEYFSMIFSSNCGQLNPTHTPNPAVAARWDVPVVD
jgi:hypothetical protein